MRTTLPNTQATTSLDNLELRTNPNTKINNITNQTHHASTITQTIEHSHHLLKNILIKHTKTFINKKHLNTNTPNLNLNNINQPEYQNKQNQKQLTTKQNQNLTRNTNPTINHLQPKATANSSLTKIININKNIAPIQHNQKTLTRHHNNLLQTNSQNKNKQAHPQNITTTDTIDTPKQILNITIPTTQITINIIIILHLPNKPAQNKINPLDHHKPILTLSQPNNHLKNLGARNNKIQTQTPHHHNQLKQGQHDLNIHPFPLIPTHDILPTIQLNQKQHYNPNCILINQPQLHNNTSHRNLQLLELLLNNHQLLLNLTKPLEHILLNLNNPPTSLQIANTLTNLVQNIIELHQPQSKLNNHAGRIHLTLLKLLKPLSTLKQHHSNSIHHRANQNKNNHHLPNILHPHTKLIKNRRNHHNTKSHAHHAQRHSFNHHIHHQNLNIAPNSDRPLINNAHHNLNLLTNILNNNFNKLQINNATTNQTKLTQHQHYRELNNHTIETTLPHVQQYAINLQLELMHNAHNITNQTLALLTQPNLHPKKPINIKQSTQQLTTLLRTNPQKNSELTLRQKNNLNELLKTHPQQIMQQQRYLITPTPKTNHPLTINKLPNIDRNKLPNNTNTPLLESLPFQQPNHLKPTTTNNKLEHHPKHNTLNNMITTQPKPTNNTNTQYLTIKHETNNIEHANLPNTNQTVQQKKPHINKIIKINLLRNNKQTKNLNPQIIQPHTTPTIQLRAIPTSTSPTQTPSSTSTKKSQSTNKLG